MEVGGPLEKKIRSEATTSVRHESARNSRRTDREGHLHKTNNKNMFSHILL